MDEPVEDWEPDFDMRRGIRMVRGVAPVRMPVRLSPFADELFSSWISGLRCR